MVEVPVAVQLKERWLRSLINHGSVMTPALVADSDEIDSILDLFTRYLPDVKLYYAVKANNSRPILQHLQQKNVRFDVSSPQEIAELRQLGVQPSNMILSNPIKGPELVKSFYDNGLSLLTIDNISDLKSLAQARWRSAATKNTRILVRIRLATCDVQIDLNEKFGCDESEAVELLSMIQHLGFEAAGIQFHVGTQSWNTENYRLGIEAALRVIKAARETHGIECSLINIGGGFPDPVVAKEADGLENFFKQLASVIQIALDEEIELIAEPGRVMVSGACSSVCQVIGKNIRNGTTWYYLDDGAYGLYSGKFFDYKKFQFRVIRRAPRYEEDEQQLAKCVVAGPTCDSLDIISSAALLPVDLSIGDYLCTHNMGAYSITTGCRFNGFGRIHTYIGASSVVRFKVVSDKREDFADVENL